MNNYVKTPLNYTGNKFRLLEQMQPHFPKKIKIMVDLFCGGATVGLNTECEEVYFIDSNPMVIGLLKFFANHSFESILKNSFIVLQTSTPENAVICEGVMFLFCKSIVNEK